MESRRLPIALLWILFYVVNAAQVDVKVDDTDPRIIYTGNNWTAVDNCTECGARLETSQLEGGSYHMARQTDSKAEFGFTGIAVSVYGVTIHHWRRTPPNVSFTIDGTEDFMQLMNVTGGNNAQYNQTLFQADNLPNVPHTLSIQTHDNSLFVLDYLTYATIASAATNVSTATVASNGTDSTKSAPASTSTFPSDQSASSPSTGAQPVVVGGVIGGIFGAFLIAGIIGLWFIRRANRRRRGSRTGLSNRNKHQRLPIDRKELSPAERRGRSNTVDSWSSFGGSSDERDGGGRRAGIPVEYASSGPKATHAPVPLTTTRKMEALSEAANNGGGPHLSAISTFASSSISGGEDGKEHVVHALTTDTPRHAHPIPLYGASQWPSSKRPNTADAATQVYGTSQWQNTKWPNTANEVKAFGSGSALEGNGLLEGVMFNHSNVPGHSSREEESPVVFFSEHPFRTMGSG